MAEIDSLEIKIASDATKANRAINSLIKNLGNLSKALNIDTSKLANIGKSIDLSGITKGSRDVQSKAQKVSKSLSQITEQYKDLGKGFELKGSTEYIQKQIDTLSNKLANATLKKKELEKSGKTNLLGYENAVKDVIKYENQIESLKNQILEMKNTKPELDFKISGINEAEQKISSVSEKIKTIEIPESSFGYDASVMEAIEGKAFSTSEKIREFANQLNQLEIPEIRTENLDKLRIELEKTEAKADELRTKLVNETTMGRIVEDVDDKGFRNLQEQIAIAEKKAEALRQKIKEVSDASGSENAGKLGQSLSVLSSAGKNAGNALNKASSSILSMSSRASGAVKPISKLSVSLRSLLRTLLPILGIRQLFNWGKQSIEVASDLTEVQNVVDATFGDMSYKLEEFAQNSIKQFGMSELSVKQYASRFQAMGTAMGFPMGKMSDMSIELTKLTADMASFYNVEQSVVAEDLASVFTGTTRPLRKYGLDLTQATLQEWALRNGINANVQAMSQAEKTLLRYQYVMANTGAAQGDFARTMYSWHNQVAILKMNFQELASVIGGTLVNAFKPVVIAVNEAMSAIIAFAKTISNALGKIFGWTYEEGGAGGLAEDFGYAAGAADDLAGATGKAAKNAKEMNKYIAGWHEVNNMTSDLSEAGGGGGGAGGGGAGGAGADGGKWVRGESILKGFESELDSLYKLGDYIGKTLTDAMNNINWESVYEKARNFGTGLANFLNGLISPELFGAIGKTIAGSLNTALHFLDSFGETFEWEDFGLSIASGINNFFATFDFALLADTINTWAKGILDTAIIAIDNTDWRMIGEKIGTFLEKIDFTEIAGKIIKFLWESIQAAWETWKGSFSAAPMETALLTILAAPALVGFGSKIIGFIVAPFRNVLELVSPIISTIGTTIGTISTPTLALSAAFAGLAVGLGYAFATNEEVRESFSQAASAIRDGLQPAIEFVANTLLPDLNSGWERLKDILSPLGDFLNDVFVSIWQDMINPALKYIGETVLPKVTEAFENLWNKVLVPLGSFLSDILEPVIKVVSDVLSVLWQKVVVPLANAIGNVLGKAFEGLMDIFNSVVDKIQPVIKIMQFLWNNVLTPIANYLWDKFKPTFENVFDVIGKIVEGLGKALGGLIDFIVGVFTGNWEKAWNGVKDIFKGIWNGMVSVAEGAINGIIKGINKFLNKFDGIASSFEKITGINVNIPNIPEVSLPKFAEGGITLKHTIAEIGESNKAEAIIPLTNQRAMGMIADSILENMNYGKYGGNYSDDYIQQIEEATYRGTIRAIQAAGGIKAEATFKVEGDRDSIFRITQEESRKFFRRTGSPAYAF